MTMTSDRGQSFESAERFWATRIRGPDGPPSQGHPRPKIFSVYDLSLTV